MLSSQKQKKALLVKPGKLENRTDKPNVLRLLKPNGIFQTGRKTAAQTGRQT
jgi:hypothetical protein